MLLGFKSALQKNPELLRKTTVYLRYCFVLIAHDTLHSGPAAAVGLLAQHCLDARSGGGPFSPHSRLRICAKAAESDG